MTKITVHVLMKAVWPRRWRHDVAKSVGAGRDLSSGLVWRLLADWHWLTSPSTVFASTFYNVGDPIRKKRKSLPFCKCVCGFCVHFFLKQKFMKSWFHTAAFLFTPSSSVILRFQNFPRIFAQISVWSHRKKESSAVKTLVKLARKRKLWFYSAVIQQNGREFSSLVEMIYLSIHW